jgi:hypothetical protein
MRKLFAPVIVVVAIVAAACSGPQGSVTAPSAVAPVASSSRVHANLTAPLVTDACRPPINSVVFDQDQLGRVVVTNNSPCTNDFLYVVWLVNPADETNQTLVAEQGARLGPGEQRQLTVGFHEVCGSKYQRDVYIGISDDTVPYSFSDVHNYFFAALGQYQFAPRCDNPPNEPPHITPPTDICPNLEGDQASVPEGMALVGGLCLRGNTPPTDVCPNLEGVQATVPAGFILSEGACVPVIPPPPGDVCPNLEGIQSTVPGGYTLVAGQCVIVPPPPIDLCPNLEGIQSTVPGGYTLVAGQCVIVPPPPALCTDPTASNFGLPAPCSYPPPTAPSCGSIGANGAIGPLTADVPGSASGRLAYARSLDSAFGGIVAVHPAHGGTFGGSNSTGFTFTSGGNYAVIIFHHMGNGGLDLVFVGVHTGDVLNVPTDGGDVFYFGCPQ